MRGNWKLRGIGTGGRGGGGEEGGSCFRENLAKAVNDRQPSLKSGRYR